MLVAALDAGSDILPVPHRDIASRVNFSLSRSFFPVTANPDGNPAPATWDDKNGHGSWCHSAAAAPTKGQPVYLFINSAQRPCAFKISSQTSRTAPKPPGSRVM